MEQQQFDLNKIIAFYGIDRNELAKVLFPEVSYPNLAIARILKGDAVLNITQVYALANFIGVPVVELIDMDSWRAMCENGHLTFTKRDYKAILNYKGAFFIIMKGGKVIDRYVSAIPIMSITEFIKYINNIIKNYDNGNFKDRSDSQC